MTEEIKEILDRLERQIRNDLDCLLSPYQSKQLLDYITNLQQLYENALKVNQNENKYRTELESKYVLLQQENERLKEELKNRPIVDFTFDVYKELEELEDYKSRCEKANEWIHKHQQTIENMRKEKFYILNLGIDDTKEFKNILNGSDENE